ncbi:MAG: hypothetical protein AAGD00_06300 [Planctomycetota bacterium]
MTDHANNPLRRRASGLGNAALSLALTGGLMIVLIRTSPTRDLDPTLTNALTTIGALMLIASVYLGVEYRRARLAAERARLNATSLSTPHNREGATP